MLTPLLTCLLIDRFDRQDDMLIECVSVRQDTSLVIQGDGTGQM